MNSSYCWPGTGLLLAFTACSPVSEPAPQYKLSAAQLAWQGYHQGEVLRFGNSQSSKVRTYRITEVEDRLDSVYIRSGWLPLPQKEAPVYQHITVLAQRTDSTYSPQQILDLQIQLDRSTYDHPTLRAVAQWGSFYYAQLPIDAANSNAPLDSVSYPGTKLLPSVTLGPVTYSHVLHVLNRTPDGPTSAGSRTTRQLYYAQGKGVVAFVETGTGLWYRLP